MDPSRLVFAIILLSWHSTQAGNLTTTLCSPKLPQRMGYISALYDQDDTIYLFGGKDFFQYFNNTLKYSISLDTLEPAGQLPVSSHGGATVMNKFRDIFHLPGREINRNPTYQYFPDTQSFTTVRNLTSAWYGYGLATVMPDQDTALFFGGSQSPRNAFSLNLNTLESKSLPTIPEYVSYAPGIWVEKQNAAYIFNGGLNSNVKYLRATNQFQLLENKDPLTNTKAAIWDGRFGYLIGTNNRYRERLVQFDPDTGNFTLIPAENFPAVAATAAVYVEKLNRIYMFGGQWDYAPNYYADDIWYISLDPLDEPPTTTTEDSSPITTMDPDIFNCVGRPDALYPYPGECAKYVICRDNYGYAFDCPEPLQFHPVNRQCTFPEWVDCDQKATSEN